MSVAVMMRVRIIEPCRPEGLTTRILLPFEIGMLVGRRS